MGRKMENINPIKIFEDIKEKYLSFVTTTVCRTNTKLKKELSEVLNDDGLLWQDLIVQIAPQYQKEELGKLSIHQRGV